MRACLHICVCVCVLSIVSSRLNLANLPPLSAILHFPLSPSSSPSLSLCEQIELLNELFLWAPNAHPQLSICSFPPSVHLSLPPSTHPSILLSPSTTLLSPQLPCCNNVYIYRHWSTHMHTVTVTYAMHGCVHT